MLEQLSNLLGIEKDEQKPVWLLFAHSFFIGIFLAYFFSYSNGTFLKAFSADYLPYAYIVSGLMGYGVTTYISRLQTKVPLSTILLFILGLLLVLMLFFYVGLLTTNEAPWLVFLIFVWVVPFYSLIALQFWGMVMRLFDLRQGKRLFGLLGTGDVISSLIGFVTVPFIVAFIRDNHLGNTSVLMLLSIIGLALGIVFQVIIIRNFPEQLSAKKKAHRNASQSSLKEVVAHPYYRWLFLITICSVFGQYFVDYNFMGYSRESFDKNELTSFFGTFYAISKVIELLMKTVVAGRLLNQYGLRLGLSILPILLVVFTVIALGIDVLSLGASMVFVPWAMNKLFDRSARKGIDEPSVKVLYQPLDGDLKLAIQNQTEGKAKQIAVIASGLLLMGFSYFNIPVVFTTLFLLLILAAWIATAFYMYTAYRKVVRDKLSNTADGEDRHTFAGISMLWNYLSHTDATHVNTALLLGEQIEPGAMLPKLPELLQHADDSVRETAMQVVLERKPLNLLPLLELRYQQERNQRIKGLLESAIAEFKAILAYTPAQVTALARSSKDMQRERVAIWLEYADHPNKTMLLRELASDREITVAQAAIKASASVKSVELWSLLIDFLRIPELSNASVPALVAEGDAVVPLLSQAFNRLESYPLAQMKIIQICGRISSKNAIAFLADKLLYPNREVQLLAADMLAQIGFIAEDSLVQVVKDKISLECGHLAWLLAAQVDLGKRESCADLVRLLVKAQEQTIAHIFQLLAIIVDADAVSKVAKSFLKGSKEGIALGMEMLDMLLPDDLKMLVMASVDATSASEKLSRLHRFAPQVRLSPADRLRDIIYKDFSRIDRWMKASAIHQLLEIDTKRKLAEEIHALIFNEDFFLKETALVAIHRLNPQLYDRYTAKEPRKVKIKYDRVTGFNRALKRIPSNYEEVLSMQLNPFLRSLPESQLVKLSEITEQEAIEVGAQPSLRYRKGNHVHFIIEGRAIIYGKDGVSTPVDAGDVMGLLEDIDLEGTTFEVFEPLKVFYLEKNAFFAVAQLSADLIQVIYAYLTQDTAMGQSIEVAEEEEQEELLVNSSM